MVIESITNEQGVVVYFGSIAEGFGISIVSVGIPFPDATIRVLGELYRAEFEFRASTFLSHNHDIEACDVIICWINDWPDCPITVWGLSEPGWFTPVTRVAGPFYGRLSKSETLIHQAMQTTYDYVKDHPSSTRRETVGALELSPGNYIIDAAHKLVDRGWWSRGSTLYWLDNHQVLQRELTISEQLRLCTR